MKKYSKSTVEEGREGSALALGEFKWVLWILGCQITLIIENVTF